MYSPSQFGRGFLIIFLHVFIVFIHFSLFAEYHSGESYYFSFAFLKLNGNISAKETEMEFDRTLMFPLPSNLLTSLLTAICAAFPAFAGLMFEVVTLMICLDA